MSSNSRKRVRDQSTINENGFIKPDYDHMKGKQWQQIARTRNAKRTAAKGKDKRKYPTHIPHSTLNKPELIQRLKDYDTDKRKLNVI